MCPNSCWNMEEQKITAVVAIDLSAAFDTVDHDVLLDVINNRFGLEWKHPKLDRQLSETKEI